MSGGPMCGGPISGGLMSGGRLFSGLKSYYLSDGIGQSTITLNLLKC